MGSGLLIKVVKVVNMKHKTREGFVSEFKTSIGITLDDMSFIDKAKGKKSKAGKLKEIIAFYKLSKNL